MPTHKGLQAPTPKHNSAAYGNAWNEDNKITPTAALALADVVVLLDIPAGTRLTGMRYRNGDFDTGTTLQHKIGYRSVHPDKQVATVDDYFVAAGATALQAAQASWVELTFDPITFQEPVQIIATVTAAATGVSGTPSIFLTAEGRYLGVN